MVWSIRSIWCTLSSAKIAEEAVVVLQDLRPEFCVFGGERSMRPESVPLQRVAWQTRVLESARR